MTSTTIKRRDLLATSIGASLAAAIARAVPAADSKRPPRIMLRSSWQTVNIGDIAHTPGVLRILETHLPEAQIVLWPSRIDNGVDQLLKNRFPKLAIANSPSEKEAAIEECDFLLHSSGASFVAEKDAVAWRDQTGKPFGVYGITLPEKKSSSTVATSADAMAETIRNLGTAAFVYFRDSKSLALAKRRGCRCPIMEFGPDGAFACDLRDDAAAHRFMAEHDLETGKFLCCIPRLRYTPYWAIPSKNRAFDPVKHARNEAMKDHDHGPLRDAITQVVRGSDVKVLLCPEDQTQMQVGKRNILDQLPEVVRRRVVWRPNYWLTGEAISTYTRSLGVFGNEMHSPIMCIGHGIPAIVCRFDEQTTKGYMWQDIGLGEWLFDLDQPDQVRRIVPTVMSLIGDPVAVRAKAAKARAFVQDRQAATMETLKNVLG